MMTETMTVIEGRSLARVREWERNPRGGVYRRVEELAANLREVGLQDAIHVWARVDGDLLLKGHRRFAAMKLLGWESCKQVVLEFEDEAAAFRYLLADHGHTDALDNWEHCVAARSGVELGMTADELAPVLGVKVERVQLWLDLAAELPQSAKVALSEGGLSLNTAELLLAVPKESRREVTQLVLKDAVTGEVMGHAQAKAFIEMNYLRPAKWRRDWEAGLPKLRRKFAVTDGFEVVAWERRGEYTMGDSGQPWPDFEFGDAFPSGGAGGQKWGERAVAVGVPVMVVAAPLHADGLVQLVDRKLLLAAEGQVKRKVEGGAGVEDEEEDEDEPGEVTVVGAELGAGAAAVRAMDEVVGMCDEAWARRVRLLLGGIMERLTANPAMAMTTGVWELFLPHLAHVAMDVDAGAAELWTGCGDAVELLAKMRADKKHRGSIRWVVLLLLCCESDAGEPGGLEMMERLAGELGCGELVGEG